MLTLTLFSWLSLEHGETLRHRDLADLDLGEEEEDGEGGAARMRNVVDSRDVFR